MLYLLHGNDTDALGKELQKWKKDNPDAISFDLHDTIVSDISATLYTNSLFSSKKLVILRGIIGNAESTEKLLKELKEHEVPEGTTLLFYAAEKIAANLILYKFIKEHGSIIEKSIDKVDTLGLIKRHLEENGIKADAQVISFLVTRIGGNYQVIPSEMKKLALFLSPSTTVTKEDIPALKEVISVYTEAIIWDYLDSISAKDRKRAIVLLSQLLAQGQDPLGILALLQRQVRLLIFAKMQLPLGVAPFIAAKIKTASQAFPLSFLLSLYRKLEDAEYAAKNGADAGNLVFLLSSII